jgi:cellulose synthase/poly-beta-1,6-N-acetylglucosamine synthase-like glycosyltransferase
MALCGTSHIYVRGKILKHGVQMPGKRSNFLLPSYHIPDIALQVVVCIVADGRKKIHPRVLDCLTLLGVYQSGDHMKNMVNKKEVTAHLFEYTTTFALDPNLHFRYPDKGIVPTQIIFCMKEKNQKKINSHRWFFNAFAPMLQVSVMIEFLLMPDLTLWAVA